MALKRLLLFDIDGTLTRSHNGYIPFNEALFETFGVAGDIRTVVPDGNTDPVIVEEIFAKADRNVEVTQERWQSFGENLRRSYARALGDGRTRIAALPGVLDLVRALEKSEGIYLGIVTGNLEVIARVKLDAAALGAHLKLGAYGSDSRRRADLPAIAKERWERKWGASILAEQCVIVGDTPKDLAAARENGMRCVLVGTGRYPASELESLGPDACLPDFIRTEEVVYLLRNLG